MVGAREIQLSRGLVAIVDEADFDWLSQWKWCAVGHPGYFYAGRWAPRDGGPRRGFKMHRELMSAAPGVPVDHINGNRLDNRRANLRFCTGAENNRNRAPNRTPSLAGFKGVYFDKNKAKWQATIIADGRKHSHYAPNLLAAARAYDELARQYHGQFARLNFPDGEAA